MSLLDFAMPVAAAILLIVFFSGLPLLSSCRLPRAPRRERFSRADALLIAGITAAYAFVAFWQLGNTDSPETFVEMAGQEYVLTLPEPAAPERLMLFAGVGSGGYTVQVSFDGEEYTTVHNYEQNYVSVLKWESLTLFDVREPICALRISCGYGTPWLGELVLLDENGQSIPLRCPEQPALCDEADTVPQSQNFMNSSYFDEIYHARTAWEHLNRVWPYEISHPPLGKEILSLGILLFGMTPFGWRFSGTLFGVLMLPVMYLLLKRLFSGKTVPALGTLVFASDFMHFVQTRIATIDTYGVFFILLMYLFMFLYLKEHSLGALALCGLSFGLGVASKWTGLYAGAGLAVLWLGDWLLRASDARAAALCVDTQGEAQPEPPAGDPVSLSAFLGNVGFCLLFFVLLPCLIYYFSYLPYGAAKGLSPFSGEYLRLVLDNQRFMFQYHAGIVAEHPYSSRWYQWLLNIRPILYYLEYFNDGTRSSICAMLNPALCWAGFLSVFVLLYTVFFRRDRLAAFILVGFLAQLLPWVFISRLTFAYHYFPSSVFLVLALGYVFALMRDNRRRYLPYVLGFTGVSLLLFALFYPVLSGRPVDDLLSSRLLQWLPTWPL